MFRDITERKNAEAARERLAETLVMALDAADLGTWEWEPSTDTMVLSARASAIFGVEPGLTHRWEYLRGIIRSDFRDRARQEATRAMAERGDYNIEYPLVTSRWVAARGRGVYSANGGMTRMIGVVQDVTARKESEAALRESETRHRVLVNATSDVVYRMTADWAEMQPLDGRQLVASNASPIRDWMSKNVPKSEHAQVEAAIARAITEKGTFELEHRVIRPDGSIGWTFSRAVPIVDAAGGIVEWFGTARDVTDQKQAEEELARVTDESERQRRLYETVLSATPDFVYVFSLDHRVLYANDSLIEMWGRGRDGAIGKSFVEIGYEPWHAQMHDQEIDQVRATKRPMSAVKYPLTGRSVEGSTIISSCPCLGIMERLRQWPERPAM